MAAYIQCLSQNGVTITMPSGGPNGAGRPSGGARPSGAPEEAPEGAGMPSGAPGGGGGRELTKPNGVDDATWTKATAACASQKPSGGNGADNAAN